MLKTQQKQKAFVVVWGQRRMPVVAHTENLPEIRVCSVSDSFEEFPAVQQS